MRILLTQHTLLYRGGAELFVLDVARELRRRGHDPVVFTAALGDVADDLRAAGIQAVDDLDELTTVPDLIHGQSHLEILQALLRFPGTAAVEVCHSSGVVAWFSVPLRFPRIVRYVAVSELIRERLIRGFQIPESRIDLLLNFADLGRFRPRSPLPARPQRALILSNQASEATYVPVVRAACKQFGIDLDTVGHSYGNRTATPEDILPRYDIVFARGRAAIEAMVVGAYVVLCDVEGTGPAITADNLDHLRGMNFGIGSFTGPCTTDVLVERIAGYDPVEAARVSARMRDVAGLETAVDRLIAIYDAALRQFHESPAPTEREERDAIIQHARWMSRFMLHQGRGPDQADVLQLIQRIATERDAIEREREVYARDREAYMRDQEAITRERATYARDRAAMEQERAAYATLTVQLEEKERQIADLVAAADERLLIAEAASAEAARASATSERLASELHEKEQIIAGLRLAAAERLDLIERLNREMAEIGRVSAPPPE